MGIFDGFLNMMRLGPDDDDDFYDEGYVDEVEEKPKASRKQTVSTSTPDFTETESITDVRRPKEKPQNKITPMRSSSRRAQTAGGMEVCVIKPTSFDESREITETLLANRTVVLNVEGLDVDIAQRIIDFTSGSCFAINGNLQKISNYIFIITPENVDISGDFQSFMDSFDISGI
ncbi:MAG: cell division protein SepF [bacterium]|nr:cell division protein SepF [bacterium]MDY4099070.1 cell division protein SepF [Lachnospiraceae bacterium]